CARRWLLYW
nr:immunoglobulin heavy chain junction region [Mus musculus]